MATHWRSSKRKPEMTVKEFRQKCIIKIFIACLMYGELTGRIKENNNKNNNKTKRKEI